MSEIRIPMTVAARATMPGRTFRPCSRLRYWPGSVPLVGTLLLAGGLLMAGCAGSPHASPAHTLKISGAVHGGQQPVTGSTIQLYAVGTTGDGSAATTLLSGVFTTSDGSGVANNSNANAGNNLNALPAGEFTISGDYTCTAGEDVYLVSTGGNPGLTAGSNNPSLALMVALGPCSAPSFGSSFIFVDELTTFGSIAALAPYMSSYSAIGSGSGDATALQAAFNTVSEYTDTSQGIVPGPALPASTYASSYEIQTLGDAISACINSAGGGAGDGSYCGTLFTDTTPSSGLAPTDTIGAALNIVNNPGLNACPIYNLILVSAPFQPTLSSCPSSWTLPISTLSVSVAGPSTVTLGQTAQYTAAVSAPMRGATNQSVTWMVNSVVNGNATVGTISATGLYTPPATAPGAVTIGAASVLSSAATGSAAVNVVTASVAVSGPANVLAGAISPYSYSAVVTGATNQTVTWMVNGVIGGSAATGTISNTAPTIGQYTAPATAPATAVTISAQSTAVPAATGSLGITVSSAAVAYATGDTRSVTQPAYPAVCQVIQAQFNTSQRSSPPASDDTSRLQTALTACRNTGQSVELTPSGTNNAFYSSELTVTGEGLVIDAGVTLLGSNNYATQSELLNISGTNASLMGPGIVDGRGDLLSNANHTRLVEAKNLTNFIVYNVTLTQAIYPNLYVQSANGFTAWGISILTPATRSNADGIDIDSTTNATVINSTVEDGDDGIAVKTNSSAASNITVANNRFYGTHGISIGSETTYGVTNILFSGNYLYGTDKVGNLSGDPQGVNIKTNSNCGGTVQQVTYQNTCLHGVKHLIVLDTGYTGTCSGGGIPTYTDIVVNGLVAQSSVSGAYTLINGVSAANPIVGYFANINLDNTSQDSINQYATIALDNSNTTPSGTGIATATFSTPGSVPSCTF